MFSYLFQIKISIDSFSATFVESNNIFLLQERQPMTQTEKLIYSNSTEHKTGQFYS